MSHVSVPFLTIFMLICSFVWPLTKKGYFGALGAFLLNLGIEHEGNLPARKRKSHHVRSHTRLDHVDTRRDKKYSAREKLHRRSKSMGSFYRSNSVE